MNVIRRYLDCGDLHFGFARVKCEDCGHEFLLAYSCKHRHFCPSCHQKRVVEFGEWLCEKVLKYVPHRQWVFSIPKRLRIYFMMDRKLLAKLSQCAWKVLNLYLTQAVAYDDAKAGAAVAVHSFGDFQNFHPHLHILSTDGCFYDDDAFMVCPPPNTGDLEELFRHEVFKMLKAEGTLLCPKCLGSMKIISFIEDEDVISKILKHLGLWEVKQRPPPRAKAPPRNIHIDYTVSQIPSYEDNHYCDPDYPIEMYAS